MGVSDWHDCMWQTVTISPFIERDAYGQPTYDTAISIANSRVVYKDQWLRKPDGSEVLARGIVWLGTYMRVYTEDKLVLPDGVTKPILLVESYPDEMEMHHTKVVFG